MTRLQADFYQQSTRKLARALLGKTLVRQLANETLRCIIVEVESYLDKNDPAAHSHCGQTKRNASMFKEAGTLYVYTIHNRFCINVVSEARGRGAAVLIRAVEPIDGMETMWNSRFPEEPPQSPLSTRELVKLTQGPGRLSQALEINLKQNGLSLVDDATVWLEAPDPLLLKKRWKIRSSARIGISKATDLPLRYFIDGNKFVSGKASEHSQGRKWSFQG